MKRISYITLLLVVLLQLGGLLLFYSAQQYYAQYRMARAIANNEVEYQHFTISASDYKKCMVEDDEIHYNGKRYDVVACDKRGDKVELTVVRDIAEEEVVDKIRLISGNAGKHKHDVLTHVMKYVAVFNPAPTVQYNPDPEYQSRSVYAITDEPTVSRYIDTSYPPPRLV